MTGGGAGPFSHQPPPPQLTPPVPTATAGLACEEPRRGVPGDLAPPGSHPSLPPASSLLGGRCLSSETLAPAIWLLSAVLGAEWGEHQASGRATPRACLPGCMGSGLPFTAARSLETHVHTPHRTARPMTPSRGLRSRRDPKRRCPSRLRPRALLESHLVRWYEEHSTRSPQERRGPCDGHRVPSRPPPRALPAAVLMPWRERTGGPGGRGRGEAWTPGLPPTLGPDWPCVPSAPPLVASLPGPQVTTQEMGSFRLQSPGGVGGDHSRAGHS